MLYQEVLLLFPHPYFAKTTFLNQERLLNFIKCFLEASFWDAHMIYFFIMLMRWISFIDISNISSCWHSWRNSNLRYIYIYILIYIYMHLYMLYCCIQLANVLIKRLLYNPLSIFFNSKSYIPERNLFQICFIFFYPRLFFHYHFL